ncbi:MAG: DedA family protein [Candidatus Gracilibacteria bacterium]|nr:DedA family protein [Candidatus Gracilibacteria bacterium]
MLKKIADIIIKLLIILTFVLAILALVRPDLIKDFIEWVKIVVHGLGNWNYLIIFLSSLIEGLPVLGVVVPGQNILLIVGGFFAEKATTNLYYVIFIASIGAILSNYLGYILGKYHGEEFFKKYGLWFGIGETEVRYLKKGIKKWGPWGIIAGKFHNVARAFVPFIAGSMGMHHRTFFIYNVIGSTIRAVTFIILGTLFAQYYETLLDYLMYIMIGVLVITGIYIYRFKKREFLQYMKEKNEELEKKL